MFSLCHLSKHPLAIKTQATDFTGSIREEDNEEGRQTESTSVELTGSFGSWSREDSVSHNPYSSRKLETLLEDPGEATPLRQPQLIADSDPFDTPTCL